MMKKFLTAIVIAMLSLSCFMFACKKADNSNETNPNPNPNPPPVIVKTLEFNEEKGTVLVYEELQLIWTEENLEDKLIFVSSDPSKATVNEDGLVKGVTEGTCTITVSADDLQDEIEITVLPYDENKLEVINVYNTANLFEGESKNLGIKMGYNGKPIDLGSFTYEIPEADSAIATVDAEGNITAGSKGETTMTVVGTVGSKVIDTVEVKIIVGEKVELTANALFVQLYVYEGSEEIKKPTEFQLELTALVNGVEDEDAVIELSGYDQNVITVDANYLITVNGVVGNTTITATYVSEKGTSATITIGVTVLKPEKTYALDDIEFIATKNDDTNFKFLPVAEFNGIDLSAYNGVDELASVSVDGRILGASEYSYEGTTLKIKTAALANYIDGASKVFDYVRDIQIIADTDLEYLVFNTTITVVDFNIYNTGLLKEYITILQGVSQKAPVGHHAILTANIDFENNDFRTRGVDTDHGYFYGVLDGRGHTIANINMPSSGAMFWGLAQQSVIKNIAFVNVHKDSSNDGALLAWNGAAAIIENVYIQGTVNSAATNTCGIVNNAGSMQARNFVMDIEFTKTGVNNVIDRAGATWQGQNTIGISKTASGFANAVPGGDANNYFLRDISEMKDLSTEIVDLFTSEKVGENPIWVVSNGVVVFKTAEAYLNELNEKNNANEIKVDMVQFIEDTKTVGEDTVSFYVLGASTYTLESNFVSATYAVKSVKNNGQDVVGGVTIDGNVLDVAQSVPAGSEIVIEVKALAPHTAKEFTETITFVVGDIQFVTLTGDAQEIVKNQADKSQATIDLGESQLNDPKTLSAKFKGSVISAENILIQTTPVADGEGSSTEITTPTKYTTQVIVDGAGLTTSGEGMLEINLKTEEVVEEATVVKYFVLKAPVNVVDFEIGTKEDFIAYVQASNDNKLTKDSVARVTADIDLENTMLPARTGPTVGTISGLLDGQGHSIRNLRTYRYSMFGQLKDVVIKDIAFVNIIKPASNNGGLFSDNQNINTKLENVFVQGVMQANNNVLWGLAQNFGGTATTLTNVIVEAEFPGDSTDDTRPHNVLAYTGAYAKATNVYAISNSAQGYSSNKEGPVYGSLRHVTASMDAATLKTFTDTGVWEYDEETASLYFKGTKAYLADPTTNALEVNTSKFIPNGTSFVVLQESAYELTTNMIDTIFTLKEEVAGVAIENGILTIAKDVPLGTAIEFTATAYGSIANTKYEQSFKLAVGSILEVETYARNKATTTTTDIKAFGATTANTFVTVNGTDLTLEQFTVEEGILKINIENIPTGIAIVNGSAVVQAMDVKITIDDDATDEVPGKVIMAKYIIIDKIIETADDFEAWVDDVKATNATAVKANYFVQLAKDIDLTGKIFTHSSRSGSGVIQGILDGNGHTISNLTLNNKQTGLFANFGVFTVKNLAIKDAVAISSSTRGFLFAQSGLNASSNLTISNCYIKFTSEKNVATYQGLVFDAKYMNIYDSVLELNYATANIPVYASGVLLENVITFSTNNKGAITSRVDADGKELSTNYGLFETTRELLDAVYGAKVDIERFDDLKYWTTENDYPVWGGAKA